MTITTLKLANGIIITASENPIIVFKESKDQMPIIGKYRRIDNVIYLENCVFPEGWRLEGLFKIENLNSDPSATILGYTFAELENCYHTGLKKPPTNWEII